MELTYLRTFCEVVSCGSYTRAAEKLGYAQSSITAQIAKLEKAYGAKLLERSGRGMVPTFAGNGLLPYARQMLLLNEEAKEVISGGHKGELIIGSIEMLAAYYLPHRLYRYRSDYPGIQLRVQPGTEVDILSAVANKSADCGLIFDMPYVSEELATLPLRQEQLYIVVHSEHPLALENGIQPVQLQGIPLILTEDTCTYRRYLLHLLKESDVHPHIDMEFGNLEAIKQAVKHRWGAAFLPGYAVEEERQTGELKAIPLIGNHSEFYIQLIYRKERWISPAFNTFIQQMKQQ